MKPAHSKVHQDQNLLAIPSTQRLTLFRIICHCPFGALSQSVDCRAAADTETSPALKSRIADLSVISFATNLLAITLHNG
jgi:hypothetical protein